MLPFPGSGWILWDSALNIFCQCPESLVITSSEQPLFDPMFIIILAAFKIPKCLIVWSMYVDDAFYLCNILRSINTVVVQSVWSIILGPGSISFIISITSMHLKKMTKYTWTFCVCTYHLLIATWLIIISLFPVECCNIY